MKSQNGTPKVTANRVYNACMTGNVRSLPTWMQDGVQSVRNLGTLPPWLFSGRSGSVRHGGDSQGRNIDLECGYPETDSLNVHDFKALYDRVSLARRINDIWPDESLASDPEVYETDDPEPTPFETAWNELIRRVNLWHFVHRADRISGWGQFGILFLGLSGGGSLASPAFPPGPGERGPGRPPNPVPRELVYLRAYSEQSVRIIETETDESSPRFGEPTLYEVILSDPTSGGKTSQRVNIHWTRVIHLADNREESEVFGVPRLLWVYNDVLDIRKVGGASAEMFWKGGFPGLQWVTQPEFINEGDTEDDAIRDEVEAYQRGLQRYLTAKGGEWKSLAPQVANPSQHLEWKIKLICSAIGVPFRIFMGTESAHLASTQDASAWKERLRGRQLKYLEPMVIRPLVDRLVALGALPTPQKPYVISWRDLQTLSDKDLAEVALKRTQAMMQYVNGKVFAVLPPRLFYTMILGFTDEQANVTIRKLGGSAKVAAELKKLAVTAAPVGGAGAGRRGNPPAGDVGRPPGRVEGQPS